MPDIPTTPDNLWKILDTDTPDVPRDLNHLADDVQLALNKKSATTDVTNAFTTVNNRLTVLEQGGTKVYPNAGARPAGTEGQLSYLDDINSLEIWSNGAWNPFGGTTPFAYSYWEGTVTMSAEYEAVHVNGAQRRAGGRGVSFDGNGDVVLGTPGVYTIGVVTYTRSHQDNGDFAVGYGNPATHLQFGGTAQRQNNGWWQSLLVVGYVDTSVTGPTYCAWSWGQSGRTVERVSIWVNWMTAL